MIIRVLPLEMQLGINTEAPEFCPAFYGEGLVFVSRFKSGQVDANTGETFFELFYAEIDPNKRPNDRKPFSLEINSHLHEGPVTFGENEKQIFFTRSNIEGGVQKSDKAGKIRMNIYQARKGYFDWENIEKLPFNSDEYSCMHPSLSDSGTRLFFTSNMPGGYGGSDIYFVEKLGNSWSKPINLGPEINTHKNESFPFIHKSGILFFASEGHKGFGGLDLFMIDISLDQWGEVINLGTPFNSTKDDFGILMDEEGKTGYFSSSREGGFGADDIYTFETTDGIKGVEFTRTFNTKVIAFDQSNNRRLPETEVRLFELEEDGNLNDTDLYDLELSPSPLNSNEMELNLIPKKLDELGTPKVVTDKNGEAVLPILDGKKYLLLASKAGYFSAELRYDPKDNEYLEPVEIKLEPSNCLDLNGVVVHSGSNTPIPYANITVINECNGREESVRANINGEFFYCLEIGCDFVLTGSKEGFESGKSRVSTIQIRGRRSVSAQIKLNATSEISVKEPLKPGTIIVLDDIFYDFNKSSIRSGEAKDLKALARLMQQYSSMEIELGAHTDSRGTDEYNLTLSLKRAESARRFLIEQGISAHRIKAFGYGETYLRNSCDDSIECSEEEHQYNRRTEVKIIEINEKEAVFFNERNKEK